MDINCDMGESSPLWPYALQQDIQLLDFITSMNLACGMHAGDPYTMHILCQKAHEKGVAIGAHPSYPDKENFGRTSLRMSKQELYDVIIYQLAALQGFLDLHGLCMHHVKPHGALYNDAGVNSELADTIATAVVDFDPALILYGMPNSALMTAGHSKGLRTAAEAFADRRYTSSGILVSRLEKDALITDVDTAIRQVKAVVLHQQVMSIDGTSLPMEADTICLHGDGTTVLEFASAIRHFLNENFIPVRPV